MDQQVHGTCVAIDGAGVLLRGPSGCGKSDLALRLIDGGAVLVADDRVSLEARAGDLVASAPDALAGLLEVRGVGIERLEAAARATVRLVVDLVARETVERLPEPAAAELCGVALPLIRLDPFEASAPAKLRLAVKAACHGIIPRTSDRCP